MSEPYPNSRLEAFCDGVFAIALTLLVIEIKIPHSESIHSTHDFWNALRHLSPSLFAFLLSFVIILITWVNHHANTKLISKTSSAFIYANGFMLLTVVIMPFPTSLLGEFLLTENSSPAVILYESVMALQSVGWILFTGAILKDHLYKNEKSKAMIIQNRKFGYMAFVIYTVCAILAIWFPLTIAVITTFIWIFWLIVGINLKQEISL